MRKRYRLADAVEQVGDDFLLAQLLKNREIENIEEFLDPSFNDGFHDPFLMRDMDKAVERILKAIDNNEKILIYSDYDADGIPAGVMMKDFFDLIGYQNASNYIPHRHDEGFGLNREAIDTFAESGVNLLITLDCGIADYDEIAYANERGIDVIVTDHHELAGILPPAIAVVDPKREDCDYPFDGLCGSGVGWKVIQGLMQSRDFGIKPGQEKWLLDMVGLATLSDMVPLIDENRILGKFGLMVLRKSPRPGIQKLVKRLNMDQRFITEDDIGFMIAPRINAASRMGDPADAFYLLSTKDEAEGDGFAKKLEEINNERKGVVASIVKEVKKKLKARSEMPEVIVMGNPDWRPSLVGLVANSVSEEYKCPVFLWGREGKNLIKGSCRSDGVTDLVHLMKSLPDIFSQFGGHKMAGGFSVFEHAVHHMEERLCEIFRTLEHNEISEEIILDNKLTLADITINNYKIIERMSPFGIDNRKPLFIFQNVEIVGMKLFGKQKNHLSLTLKDATQKRIEAIAFFAGPDSFKVEIRPGIIVDIVAHIEKAIFRGRIELRLRLVDVLKS